MKRDSKLIVINQPIVETEILSYLEIGHVESEIQRLDSEIKSRMDCRSKLVNKLKKLKVLESEERTRQVAQRFQAFVENLPHVRTGSKYKFADSEKIRKARKAKRDHMIVDELKHRKAKNPDRPLTYSFYPEKSLASELAKELEKAGVRRCGYDTIKTIWAARGKN